MEKDSVEDRVRKQKEADKLTDTVEEASAFAKRAGLEPFDVEHHVVDHQEMNRLIAYQGFPERYPHWRWGQNYEDQSQRDRMGMGKAFEIVNNDDPARAFLQESNSLADQKAVITHVQGHSDFFANNQWFQMFGEGSPNATQMMAEHSDKLSRYMDDPDIDSQKMQRFIDSVLTVEDNIDQHEPYRPHTDKTFWSEDSEAVEEDGRNLDLSEEVRDQVFDDTEEDERTSRSLPGEPTSDLLGFLASHGGQPSEDGVQEFEDWQKDILQVIRKESYYTAPQRMTKIANEGWATYWESVMMADEGMADSDEIMTYADHMSSVLGSPGLNPYQLGVSLWRHVENKANREEVASKLLRVEGVEPGNFNDEVDFDEVRGELEPDPEVSDPASNLDAISERLEEDDPRFHEEDYGAAQQEKYDPEEQPWRLLTREGLCRRHYSLNRDQNAGFLEKIPGSRLQEMYRTMFDRDRYESEAEALEDVDRKAGWDQMLRDRSDKNDVQFIDEYATGFLLGDSYGVAHEDEDGGARVTSVDPEDVKQRLLLEFTNFGKPSVQVTESNYENRGELMLEQRFNGIAMDGQGAKQTLERVHDLWGRPVNLRMVDYKDGSQERVRLRYDGEMTEHEISEDTELLSEPEIGYGGVRQ
jgi:stage V sporulation protein R